jgi:hypothetical protein
MINVVIFSFGSLNNYISSVLYTVNKMWLFLSILVVYCKKGEGDGDELEDEKEGGEGRDHQVVDIKRED